MLVVIGIIALLLSMLMPALRMAKEYANRAKCASNLRQIGLMIRMFANDNIVDNKDGRIPMAGDASGDHWGSAYWLTWINARDYFQLVDRFGAKAQLFQCPSMVTSANSKSPVTYWYHNQNPAPTESDLRSKADSYYPEAPAKWTEDYAGGPTVQISYTYFGVSEITPIPKWPGGIVRAPYTVYRLNENYPTIQYNTDTNMQELSATTPLAVLANKCEVTYLEPDDLLNPPLACDYTYSEANAGSGQETAPYYMQFNHGTDWSQAFINTLRRDCSVQGHVRNSAMRTATFATDGRSISQAAFLSWDYSWGRLYWYR